MKTDNNLSRVFDMAHVVQGEIVMTTGEVILPEANKQSS